MNFLRTLIWKQASKKIYKVTFPTIDLLRQFKELNIFDENQMSVLRDPIVSIRNLPRLKNEENLIEIEKLKNYFVAVGRFTKQKNFIFFW